MFRKPHHQCFDRGEITFQDSNDNIKPSNEIEKEYIVKVEGQMLESELAVLRAGVVEDGKRMPSAKGLSLRVVCPRDTRVNL